MVLQSECDELRAAWRALSGHEQSDGWRTIAVATSCGCPIAAGRRFPANEEAILFGFRVPALPAGQDLPQGRGFEVCLAHLKAEKDARVWVALCRHRGGDLELFETMVEDVIRSVEAMRGAAEVSLLRTLLERIRAWQEFMRRGNEGTLGAEAELGLFGELVVLNDLLATGVTEREAIEAWKGPLDAVHDFSLRGGAIEVKSTLSSAGFPARVASLEQLDDSRVYPLFLAGLRFTVHDQGSTLPELAHSTRIQLAASPSIQQAFLDLLLRAGLSASFSGRYTRRFRRVETRVLEVDSAFPKITRAHVAPQIITVRYDLDLDRITGEDTDLPSALQKLGVK